MSKTFQIQYLHPGNGVQIAFEVAANKEAAQKKFEDKHRGWEVLDCRCTEHQPFYPEKP